MQNTDGTDLVAQRQRAEAFRAMHAGGPVLQIANAWNAWSARIMAAAGARAIGTTSFGVSLDNGVFDGEQLPFDVALAVAAGVAGAADVPVTVDLEAGRGATPDDVGRSVAAVIATGAVGVNIEDGVPGQPGALRDVGEQCERLGAARAAGAEAGVPIFLNARCDVFFGAAIDSDRRVDEVLARAAAYREAGADGIFLPGLLDLGVLRTVTAAVDLPVNVMAAMGAPSPDELAEAGVRRISQGGDAFIAVSGALKSITERYLGGDLGCSADVVGAGMSVLPALMA